MVFTISSAWLLSGYILNLYALCTINMLISHSFIIPAKMLLKQYFASLEKVWFKKKIWDSSPRLHSRFTEKGGLEVGYSLTKLIKKLRKSLGSCSDMITTLRGVGYRFEGWYGKTAEKNKPGFSRKNDLSLKRKRPRPLHSQIHRRAPLRKLRRRIESGKRQYLLDRDTVLWSFKPRISGAFLRTKLIQQNHIKMFSSSRKHVIMSS